MAVPKIVAELVERFDRNKNVYCGGGFNETQLRREFLDPLFEALGWDVDNKGGASPLYQDVFHEYGTDVEGSQKTADYAFRVGEKVKFFVEAKKPGTRLKDDAGPALQLRRYAYSAGLPLSILSDFEEFAVYDGRVPPKKADAASRARLMYFTYDQYVDAWDEIAAVFSRAAVWSGAFDKYADENRGGKAEPPDKLFLKLLEGWRDELARNVANRNREKDLDKYELSAAVQAILDRIIFLRAAEDRGIEDRGRLEALQNGEVVYAGLMELCLEADDVYNSGLFHFRAEKGRATSRDQLTPTLHIDDAVLRKIMRELYESPYEFGVVPVEILGQVYEQFLGKTIWLDGRGVHIDYKPEVRKAKGVYYTPQYIVEYIVKNTVGELLKGCKNPKAAARLKILDPACGSGSFLLGAYQHLINWHLEWYVADGPAKHEGKVVPTPGPGPVSWRLTAGAKKDILVNNLYGVDIDPQAVEVTKLSLLLKALEGESRESVGGQTKLLRERILPDLAGNIKCGNSLIGSDYFDGELMPDEEERRRVNPFDWEVEFAEIMKAGGFDAVIGNPPYGGLLGENEVGYFKDNYFTGNLRDTYFVFFEKGFNLLKGKGLIGMIIPNTWALVFSASNFRHLLTNETEIRDIVHFEEKVFSQATVDCDIIIAKKNKPKENRVRVTYFAKKPRGENLVRQEFWARTGGDIISLYTSEDDFRVLEKLALTSVPLRDLCLVKNGIKPFEVGKGKPPQTRETVKNKPYVSERKEGKEYVPLLRGSLINRYVNYWDGDYWVKYGPWLAAPRDPNLFFKVLEKIVMRQTGDSLIGIIVDNSYVCRNNLHMVITREGFQYSLKFLLGIINSKLMNYYYSKINPEKGEALAEVKAAHLERLLIKRINFDLSADVARHDKMVVFVEEMLELHKRLAAAKSDADKKRIQRAVDATDRNIDALVYELYGLTDEEIKIIENK